MLNIKFILFSFKKDIKSGVYVDYITRAFLRNALLNGFIWGALFVSEKFIIEYLSRFVVNYTNLSTKTWTNPLGLFQTTLIWIILILGLTL